MCVCAVLTIVVRIDVAATRAKISPGGVGWQVVYVPKKIPPLKFVDFI